MFKFNGGNIVINIFSQQNLVSIVLESRNDKQTKQNVKLNGRNITRKFCYISLSWRSQTKKHKLHFVNLQMFNASYNIMAKFAYYD